MPELAEAVPGVGFEAVADEVTRKVNRAFSRLVGHLPTRISRATELQRFLQIDSKLAWQVFTVASTADPLTQTRHIPSMISIRRVTTAAGEKGVPTEVLEGIHAAVQEFEEVGKRYAGDRSSFATMVSSIRSSDEDLHQLSLQQRRGAFRLNCQLWGAQIGTSYTHFAFRLESDGSVSSLLVNRKTRFQLLRAQTNPPVYGTWQYSTETAANRPALEEIALDPQALAQYGSPLLPQFCSQPVPRLEPISQGDDWVLHVLKHEQLGRLGAVDLTHGTLHRNRQLSRLEDGKPFLYIALRQFTPAETCAGELVVHRPSFGRLKPRLQVVPSFNGTLVAQLTRPTNSFPINESVVEMGSVLEAAPVSDVQNYSEVLAFAYERAGWNPAEFDVYRVTLSYPVLATDAVVWATVGL